MNFSLDLSGKSVFWLKPKIGLAKSYHYLKKPLQEIEPVIQEYYDEFISELTQL